MGSIIHIPEGGETKKQTFHSGKRFLKNHAYAAYIILKHIRFKLQFRNQMPHLKERAERRKKTNILFSTYLMNWRKIRSDGGAAHFDDVMLGQVIKNASSDFEILSLDEDPHHMFRLYEKSRDKFEKCIFCIPLELFLSNDLILKSYVLSTKNLLGKTVDGLENFIALTGKKGSMNAFLNLLVAEKIITQIQPDIIFLSCEYGGFHRALTYISKRKGVPVIALQHGIITPTHPGYIIKNPEAIALLPDITCVYGKKYRDILLDNSIYEDKMVVITGSPRYDFLYNASETYSKEAVRMRFGIPESTKILLWTTQTHGLSDEENRANLSCVFQTMTQLQGFTLIIKQHPGETEKDTALIQEYLKKHQRNNVKLASKNDDTYELIFACDLMITRHSTTALEAIVLDKPVILLNLSTEPDGVDYVKEGVAIPVREKKDLKHIVEKYAIDDSSMRKKREAYILDHLYKVDGNATARVMEQIRKAMKKHQ